MSSMLVTYRLVRTQMQNQALAERQKCQRDGKRAPPLALAGPSPPSRGSGPSRKPKALTPKRAKHFPCVTPLKTRSFPCEGFELLVQHDRRLDRFGGHCWNRLCCSHRLGAGIPLRILPTEAQAKPLELAEAVAERERRRALAADRHPQRRHRSIAKLHNRGDDRNEVLQAHPA